MAREKGQAHFAPKIAQNEPVPGHFVTGRKFISLLFNRAPLVACGMKSFSTEGSRDAL
jgi:hypothetical protein